MKFHNLDIFRTLAKTVFSLTEPDIKEIINIKLCFWKKPQIDLVIN